MNIFNLWQTNLVLFLFFAVIYYQFYKIAISKAKNDGAAVILLQVTTAIFSLIFIPFFPLSFPSKIQTYILVLIACIFYALYDRLQGTARKHIQVSIYSIINQLNNVFVILMGIIIFKEPIVPNKILGAILIILGNISIFYNKNKFKLNYYIVLSIVASVIFAIASSIDIGISKQFNLPFYIMLTTTIPGIFIFLAQRIQVKDIAREASNYRLRYYLITGAAWFLSYYFSLRAFRYGEISIVAPLQATSVMLNVVVAYIFLNEKQDLTKKLIAALFIIFGITLTVF